jgi:hypothetical protein
MVEGRRIYNQRVKNRKKIISKNKKCNKCLIVKSTNNFYNNQYVLDGKDRICKKCTAKYSKTLWKNRIRHYAYNYYYGISLKEYNNLSIKQNHKCAICKKKEKRKRNDNKYYKLAVDHNHKTNKVRGLLCSICNTLLGHTKEDINTLQNAIVYIKNDGII